MIEEQIEEIGWNRSPRLEYSDEAEIEKLCHPTIVKVVVLIDQELLEEDWSILTTGKNLDGIEFPLTQNERLRELACDQAIGHMQRAQQSDPIHFYPITRIGETSEKIIRRRDQRLLMELTGSRPAYIDEVVEIEKNVYPSGSYCPEFPIYSPEHLIMLRKVRAYMNDNADEMESALLDEKEIGWIQSHQLESRRNLDLRMQSNIRWKGWRSTILSGMNGFGTPLEQFLRPGIEGAEETKVGEKRGAQIPLEQPRKFLITQFGPSTTILSNGMERNLSRHFIRGYLLYWFIDMRRKLPNGAHAWPIARFMRLNGRYFRVKCRPMPYHHAAARWIQAAWKGLKTRRVYKKLRKTLLLADILFFSAATEDAYIDDDGLADTVLHYATNPIIA